MEFMETYRKFLKAYWWDERDKMDAILDVDGKEEFVIYAAPVGKV